MSAPKKSLRPKARPKSIYGVEEMSTRSPDGMTIKEREEARRVKEMEKKKDGGSLKSVPSGNKGLSKLPAGVRNKMGYMKSGGSVKKMSMGGKCRGMGAATRGGNFMKDG